MYQALYRVWRPRTFSDMVGQEAIVQTLRNQVRSGRIAHAYLFCGSRGTGKTSAAKIMARAINCENPQNGDPCGECSSCRAILSDTSLDVFEMDAASNSRVEETREMLEKVEYPPQFGKYKVYIIDEVHMLSNSAFNALLKTLEEPPSYMVFILATTEPQKIPSTILSRCQRFDFGRFTEEELCGRMRHILDSNGTSATDEALQLIAAAAEGGMRDALSILDMCLNSEGGITEERVRKTLGSADRSFLFAFADALAEGDSAEALRRCGELMRSGQDVTVFLRDIGNHLRSLALVRLCGPDAVPGGTAYVEQASRFSPDRLMRMMDIFLSAQGDCRWAPSARNVLELAALKCCREVKGDDTAALLERLGELETRLDELKRSGITVHTATPAAPKTPKKENAPVTDTEPSVHEDAVPEGSKTPKEVWNDALKLIKKEDPFLFSMINAGTYGGYADRTYREFFDTRNELFINMLNAQDKKTAVEGFLNRSGGVECFFEARKKPVVQDPARQEQQKKNEEMLFEMFGRDKVEVTE